MLEKMPDASILHGDKGYDSDAIRRQVEAKGAMPNIPPKANRRWKNCFAPFLYRNRNAIQCMFCRPKDWRGVNGRESAADRLEKLGIIFGLAASGTGPRRA